MLLAPQQFDTADDLFLGLFFQRVSELIIRDFSVHICKGVDLGEYLILYNGGQNGESVALMRAACIAGIVFTPVLTCDVAQQSKP